MYPRFLKPPGRSFFLFGPRGQDGMVERAACRRDAFDLGYNLHYWRTGNGLEVDFVLYGERGLLAFEVKRSERLRDEDLAPLLKFREEYPMARAFFVHSGTKRAHFRGVEIVPLLQALKQMDKLLGASTSRPKRGASGQRRRAT